MLYRTGSGGIVEFSSEVEPVDSVSTDHEASHVLSSNLTNLSSVGIDERSESESSGGCVVVLIAEVVVAPPVAGRFTVRETGANCRRRDLSWYF